MYWNWTFKGFVNVQGNNIVQLWYDQQQENVQTDFEFMLKTLRTRSPQEWGEMGLATQLKPPYKGLAELRFKVDKKPYRPIGFFGVGQQIFTILIIATKHDFDQKCKIALKRMSIVEEKPSTNSNESNCLSDSINKPFRGKSK